MPISMLCLSPHPILIKELSPVLYCRCYITYLRSTLQPMMLVSDHPDQHNSIQRGHPVLFSIFHILNRSFHIQRHTVLLFCFPNWMSRAEKHTVTMPHLHHCIFLNILGSNAKLLYAVNLISFFFFFKQANTADIEPWLFAILKWDHMFKDHVTTY